MLAQNFCKIILIDLILALDNFLSDSAWYKGPFFCVGCHIYPNSLSAQPNKNWHFKAFMAPD